MSSYDICEYQVNQSLDRVRQILNVNRDPQHPSRVNHQYDDKFALVDLATRGGIVGVLNLLAWMGLDASNLQALCQRMRGEKRLVSLRFDCIRTCKFDKTTSREVESATKHVKEKSGAFGKSKSVSSSVTTVIEHFWTVQFHWKLSAIVGVSDSTLLAERKSSGTRKTTGSVRSKDEPSMPLPAVTDMWTETSPINKNVNITRILELVSVDGRAAFAVDRTASTTHTPRRNADVTKLMACYEDLSRWAHGVMRVFEVIADTANQCGEKATMDKADRSESGLFPVVFSLFTLEEAKKAGKGKEEDEEKNSDGGAGALEDGAAGAGASAGAGAGQELAKAAEAGAVSLLPSEGDFEDFVSAHRSSISELEKTFAKACEASGGVGDCLLTPAELRMAKATRALSGLVSDWHSVVDAVEGMLRAQLVSAIGKEIGPSDFAEYMDFHYRKLFKDVYAPQAFCYAVRRPDHYPEGTVSVEDGSGGGQPIRTMVVSAEANTAMRFKLSAAAEVSFMGERYLHACVLNKFSGQGAPRLNLVAHSRQFSSFILLVGKIAGADLFEPMDALIIQNKDDLKIPLMLETIPTPKEFKDAIESLSPEQQRFCKAFRGMQLASTLFGVCIIQIKPQLEKLLRLPEDALTKEIALTQDLMELFIKYQVPSDLMSYDPQTDASFLEGAGGEEVKAGEGGAGGGGAGGASGKIAAVKHHVAAVKAMIEGEKQKEIEEAAAAAAKRALEEDRIRMQLQMEEYDEEEDMMMDSMMECAAETRSSFGPVGKGRIMRKTKKSAPRHAMAKCCEAPMPPMESCNAPPPPAPSAAGAALPPPKPAANLSAQESQAQESQAQESQEVQEGEEKEAGQEQAAQEEGGGALADMTKIPALLDRRFEEFDDDSALRPTIIKTGPSWTKTSQKGLLSKPTTSTLQEAQQKDEKNRAFDLLDALSRSGVLSVDHAALHVIIAATHCFDKTLVDTVVQGNVNPIEKVERSALIMASTIQGVTPAELLRDGQADRVRQFGSERLMIEG